MAFSMSRKARSFQACLVLTSSASSDSGAQALPQGFGSAKLRVYPLSRGHHADLNQQRRAQQAS